MVQICFGMQKFSNFQKEAYYRFCKCKPWHGLQQHAMLRPTTVSIGKPECSSKVQQVLTWNCLGLIQVGFWYQDSYDKSIIFKACCTWEMWVGHHGIVYDFPGNPTRLEEEEYSRPSVPGTTSDICPSRESSRPSASAYIFAVFPPWPSAAWNNSSMTQWL